MAGTEQDQRNQPGQGESMIFTDMSVCRPASALTRRRTGRTWQLMDYEAEGVSGTLIAAKYSSAAPPVTLPLPVEGWHRIYLGFWKPPYTDITVRLRLTSDVAFTPITDCDDFIWDRTDVNEAFWKCADLSGQDLIIAQQSKGVARAAFVAYVRTEPMTQAELAGLLEDRARKDTRKVIAVVDGGSWLENKECTTREELWEQQELFRHSDVGKIYHAVNYGSTTTYPSEVGVLCAGNGEVFESAHGQRLYNSLHALLEQDLIPFVVGMEHAHSMGLQFHVQLRMGMGDGTWEGEGEGGFAERHPEYRILAKDGTPLAKLSFAFPEVRRFLLDIMREVAQYDIDGINLGFIRGPLFMGYEAPLVEGFIAKYGADPRQIDDADPRWLAHKAECVTQLVREAKALIDEITQQRGRKLELSAWVYNTIFHGFDLQTWLSERLLDAIIGVGVGKARPGVGGHPELAKLARDVQCKLYQGTGERKPESYIKNALEGHENGADGFMVWDIDGPDEFPEHWEIIRNMGHPERVQAFAKQLPKMKRKKMLNVAGCDFDHTYGKGAPDNWPPEMMIFCTNG